MTREKFYQGEIALYYVNCKDKVLVEIISQTNNLYYTKIKYGMREMEVMTVRLEKYKNHDTIEYVKMKFVNKETNAINYTLEFEEYLGQLLARLQKAEGRVTNNCQSFWSDSSTTSATKCMFCGKEKWQHN